MQSVTNANFGPLIAYLVPGATALFGISEFYPALRSWFAVVPTQTPTIGGFLYLTVASVALGMVVSAIRWAVVDTIYSIAGLPIPALDVSKLGRNVEPFNLLIEIHDKHFQFYSNELVALAIAYVSYRIKHGSFWPLGWMDCGMPSNPFSMQSLSPPAVTEDRLAIVSERSRREHGQSFEQIQAAIAGQWQR